MTDTPYFILKEAVEAIELKERKSKFLGFAYPVSCEEEIYERLQALKEIHPQANHHCYAWRLGTEDKFFRANDDGEPRNSAGQPILRQLQGSHLTQILVVVVRYFGGTKLGVGGLIQTYGECAAQTLEQGIKLPYILQDSWELTFPYDQQSRVDRLLQKVEGELLSAEYTDQCRYHVRLPRKNRSIWESESQKFPPLRCTQLD